jgi:hypothetical protein
MTVAAPQRPPSMRPRTIQRRPAPLNVLYIQYGDYAETLRRLDAGGPETYQSQAHSVRFIERTAAAHPTAVISLSAPRGGPRPPPRAPPRFKPPP